MFASETIQCLPIRSVSLPSLIVTGSIPEQDGDRIYNTCTVYGPNGDLLTTYRKVYIIYSDMYVQ